MSRSTTTARRSPVALARRLRRAAMCASAGATWTALAGVLAFNYLPNVGDMVIDTSESWQSSTNSYRFLRNVVMHEHGHGIGLLHVVPVTETKLMEPYLSLRFDGPQDDDIRGAHRLYGDPYEVNGTVATATPIDLTNTNLATLSFASLDRTGDVDFYRLIVPPSRRITITVTPVGGVYQVGGEDGNPPQSTIDTRAIQNLQLELRAPNGTTILASATANGVGQAEQIANFVLYPAGGNFYVRVFSGTGSTNDVQRYELRVQTVSLAHRRCGRQRLRGRRRPAGNPVQLRRQRPALRPHRRWLDRRRRPADRAVQLRQRVLSIFIPPPQPSPRAGREPRLLPRPRGRLGGGAC
jgi:hypothetical protein